MTYTELEDSLIYFNAMEDNYGRIKSKSHLSENDFEQMGFISGEIVETAEILKHGLPDSKESFELITKFLEENCPNTFSIITANLDSNSDKYETLYDLLVEINIKREDNFYFPTKIMEGIRIYK